MYERTIFVFGSNLAGRHGAGAAKFAVENHGAIYGQGVGLQGDSYGIPTKDQNIGFMTLAEIRPYIKDFIEFAHKNPQLLFMLTPIGTGLAGHKKHDILKILTSYRIPNNVVLMKQWVQE